MARLKLKRVRDSAKVVEFTGGTIGTEGYQALAEGKRYLLENVKEALSEPREWYLDKKTGVVTYLPEFEGEADQDRAGRPPTPRASSNRRREKSYDQGRRLRTRRLALSAEGLQFLSGRD